MATNPSHFADDGGGRQIAGQSTERFPVEQVSWYDAITFCNSLSKREGLPTYYDAVGVNVQIPNVEGPGYRLPTQAEWEYACRAGATTVFSVGNDPSGLGEIAWYGENSGGHDSPRRQTASQRLRFVRHDRQRLGMVLGLLRCGVLIAVRL